MDAGISGQQQVAAIVVPTTWFISDLGTEMARKLIIGTSGGELSVTSQELEIVGNGLGTDISAITGITVTTDINQLVLDTDYTLKVRHLIDLVDSDTGVRRYLQTN